MCQTLESPCANTDPRVHDITQADTFYACAGCSWYDTVKETTLFKTKASSPVFPASGYGFVNQMLCFPVSALCSSLFSPPHSPGSASLLT